MQRFAHLLCSLRHQLPPRAAVAGWRVGRAPRSHRPRAGAASGSRAQVLAHHGTVEGSFRIEDAEEIFTLLNQAKAHIANFRNGLADCFMNLQALHRPSSAQSTDLGGPSRQEVRDLDDTCDFFTGDLDGPLHILQTREDSYQVLVSRDSLCCHANGQLVVLHRHHLPGALLQSVEAGAIHHFGVSQVQHRHTQVHLLIVQHRWIMMGRILLWE
mmetsp:Transcript_4991/g.8324  ORF Transcript_4991/g.8324 Transcript_4991/m.8324 type:complete len:214 (+) Transcript_4991:341-982(+)